MSDAPAAAAAPETIVSATPAPAAAPEAAPAAPAPEAAPAAAAPAGEAPPAAEGPAETILKPEGDKPSWPDDWRERIAGDDAKELARLKRYANFDNYAKAQRDLLAKMSAGEAKKALPENATPEQVAAWRAENGIPETPDAYDIGIGDGVVWGDADKPYLDKYLAHAHANNYDPAKVKSDLVLYNQMQIEAQNAQYAQDQQFHVEATKTLKEELGPAYQATVNGVNNFLQGAPQEVREGILAGRTADGKIIGNDPAFIKWMAQLAEQVNPMASLVPAGTTDPMKAGEARIAEIEKLMRTDLNEYRSPKNAAMRAEYGELLAAREKAQSRGRAA